MSQHFRLKEHMRRFTGKYFLKTYPYHSDYFRKFWIKFGLIQIAPLEVKKKGGNVY